MNYKLKDPINFTIIFLILCSSGILVAQPEFLWAKQYGYSQQTNSSVRAQRIANDYAGNVYTVGTFRKGPLDFDPGSGNYPLTSSPYINDIFISKLDSSGNFLWAKQIHNTTSSYAVTDKFCNFKVDSEGNLYLTGYFQGKVDFDLDSSTYYLSASSSNADVFILKLNPAGNLVWAKQFKSAYCVYPGSIALDAFGNLLITGWHVGLTDFNPGVNTFNLIAPDSALFITKLDTSGNFIWAKQYAEHSGHYGSLGKNWVGGIDPNGNIYISGMFYSTTDFDPGPGIKNLTNSSSAGDLFLLKLDSMGNFLYSKQLNGNGRKDLQEIGVDLYGNLYILGWFSGTLDCDPGPAAYNLVSANNVSNMFLLKVNSQGNFLWAKQMASTIVTGGNMALDIYGDIYLTGTFSGTMDMDPGLKIFNLTSKTSNDLYITKLNTLGSFEWARQLSIGHQFLDGLVTTGNGSLSITGYFTGTVDFDPSSLAYTLDDSTGSNYILKWITCSTTSNIEAAECDSFVLNKQTYKVSGTYYQILKNARGCDSTIILDLTILKPIAGFMGLSIAGCQYVAFNFYDLTVPNQVGPSGYYTYTWDFGDGTIQTQTSKAKIFNWSHTYIKSGSYLVRLIFSNGNCTDTFTSTKIISILPAPKPGFTINSNHGCAPFALELKDTLTTNLLNKEYDFGNGFINLSNNSGLDTTIQFTTPGTYIIRQRLTGTTSCITQFSDTLVITPGLTKLDTVNVLYTTVVDSFTTYTQWNKLPYAVGYSINNQIVTDTFFTHHNAQPSLQVEKYLITAIDTCGNNSAIAPVAQTIYLQGENQNFNAFTILQYTPYETWKQGVLHYEIEYKNNSTNIWTKLDTVAGTMLTTHAAVLPDGINTNISTSQICYRIKAIEQNGNKQQSISNIVCVPVYPVVFVPNAFSPNGDGLNDYFKPIAVGLNAYIFEVYDRWGQLVYSDTPESKGWDGTFDGKALSAGAYMFRLSAAGYQASSYTNAARRVEKKGTVFLLR